jgi:hypothetical protein
LEDDIRDARDKRKIPHLAHLFDPHSLPLADFSYDEIDVVSDRPEWNRPVRDIDASTVMPFRPHFGWRDHIEL